MLRLLSACLLALPVFAVPPGAATLATWNGYLGLGGKVVADSRGDIYFANSFPAEEGAALAGPGPVRRFGPGGQSDIWVVKLSGTDRRVLGLAAIGGSGAELLHTLATDNAGNIILIGTATGSDLPTTANAYRRSAQNSPFVAKLNSTLDQLLYTSYFADNVAELNAAAVDSTGAVYLGGFARAGSIPTTPGAFQPIPPAGLGQGGGPDFLGFLAKLDPTGSRLEFSTYLGGTSGRDRVHNIVLTPSGTVVIAGQTSSADLPTTPGSALPRFPLPPGTVFPETSFLAGLDPTGSRLIFSTYTPSRLDQQLALDGAGQLYVTADTSATTGYYDTNLSRLTLYRYAADGSRVLRQRDIGGLSSSQLAVDPDGTAFVFGLPRFGFQPRYSVRPCGPNVSGQPIAEAADGAVAVVDPQNELRLASYWDSLLPLGRDAAGRFYSLDFSPTPTYRFSLLRWAVPTNPTPRLAPGCLVHGATFENVPVSPGALMTIFGDRLGPAQPQTAIVENNRVTRQLGFVTVTVDGQPAPLLSVQDRQINFVVPFTVAVGRRVDVCVSNGPERVCLAARVALGAPGIFRLSDGTPIVVNQDGSLNNPERPAPRGSVITLYLTGAGPLTPIVEDGVLTQLPWPLLSSPARAQIIFERGRCLFGSCPPLPDPVELPVEYSGAAPTLVAGVMQINIRIPAGAPTGSANRLYLQFPTGTTTDFDRSIPPVTALLAVR